ncbi:MAG: hypothetical protein WC521_07935 [Bdellovibrionales bacterium]
MNAQNTLSTPKTNARSMNLGNQKLTLFLLLGFTGYQLFLCFLNTRGFSISDNILTAAEIFLLALTAWRVFPTCKTTEFISVAFLMVYFLLLCAVRGAIDLEAPRNILIIFFAYALGRASPNKEVANKIVWIVSVIVLFFAAFEYFFPDIYLSNFNILQYHISRGMTPETAKHWMQQDFSVNGLRQSGRNLLPFLGYQRVSSVFLEPVSMGNYAIILTAWALSFDKKDKRTTLYHLVVALILIVASDSRFASTLFLFLVLLRFIPMARGRGVVMLLPLIAIGGLVVFTLLGLGNPSDDTLTGRLARSGIATLNMAFAQFLGLGIPDALGDMGVAYTLEHFGVFLCIVLWAVFALPNIKDIYASRYRMLIAVYCLAILMVSGTSFYSSKTAALAWFLYGVLVNSGKNTSEHKKPLIQQLVPSPKPVIRDRLRL